MHPLFRQHDLSLLFHLEQRARVSFAELGKSLRASRATVRNRVLAMEREGVISGYMTVFDIGALGLTGYAVYAQFRDASGEQRQQIIDYLCEHPRTYWVAKLGGAFDVLFGLQAPSVREFHSLYSEIYKEIGDKIGKSEISTRIQVSQFPRHYLIGRSRPKVKQRYAAFRSGGDRVQPGSTDIALLRVLARNARASLDELSERVSLSPATVRRRISEMEKSGIIQGYTAIVHPERLGFQIYKLLIRTRVKTAKSNEALFTFANSHTRTIFFSHVIAPWDFEVTVEVLGHEELQDIIADFRERFSDSISEIDIVITFDHFLKYQLMVE